eukprot:116298-Pelagomonas_calceolata.AAC.1
MGKWHRGARAANLALNSIEFLLTNSDLSCLQLPAVQAYNRAACMSLSVCLHVRIPGWPWPMAARCA